MWYKTRCFVRLPRVRCARPSSCVPLLPPLCPCRPPLVCAAWPVQRRALEIEGALRFVGLPTTRTTRRHPRCLDVSTSLRRHRLFVALLQTPTSTCLAPHLPRTQPVHGRVRRGEVVHGLGMCTHTSVDRRQRSACADLMIVSHAGRVADSAVSACTSALS